MIGQGKISQQFGQRGHGSSEGMGYNTLDSTRTLARGKERRQMDTEKRANGNCIREL